MARRRKSLVRTIYKVMALQMVLGLLAVIVIEIVVIGVMNFRNRIRPDTVLVVDVRGSVAEEAPRGFWEEVTRGRVKVMSDFLEAIDRAARDSRINGLVLRVGGGGMNMAKLQELRGKIREFNQSGKFSAVFLESATNRSYYLASACGSVTLVPQSILGIRGMMAESTFLRGTLDKLGIEADLYHAGDYKSASNLLTEKGYTKEHRESVEALLRDWYGEFLQGIAEGRELEVSRVASLVEQAPYTSREALEAGLVDEVAYRDQFDEKIKELNQGSENRASVGRYLARTDAEGDLKIAVLYASGTIMTGESSEDPVLGTVLGSSTLSEQLKWVREDESFKAAILRVDSPGGSAVASEIIRREVELTQKEIPVVVSMSDVAASGGYWIAMGADRIVAQPGTVTGSIGVITGKLNLKGLYDKLGMSKDYVALTENATIEWAFQNYTRRQRVVVRRIMQEYYDAFKAGVSKGRKLSLEEVEKIAQGRVWTGERAARLGLVDELGGMDVALRWAKQLADIPEAERVRLVHVTTRKTMIEKIWDALGGVSALRPRSVRERFGRVTALAEEGPVWVLVPFLPEAR
ncbi:MAG: signal peptide peptidase SppA [Acidobacteria bacterium]|nr:signal peptide peptidase SppA [Acidobacteriota bacterium]